MFIMFQQQLPDQTQHNTQTRLDQESPEKYFNFEDKNQKFFDLTKVKPLDLKKQWLGNTNEVLFKFEQKLSELKAEKEIIQERLKAFAENEDRYRMSSLKKIEFNIDNKEIYREFMKKSRRTFEQLHPILIINILSYIHSNVFVALARMRRISQIFNCIYQNESVVEFFGWKDWGSNEMSLKELEQMGGKHVNMERSLLYYKAIEYTEDIPNNSFLLELSQGVEFMNGVYHRVFELKDVQITYFQIMNRFMKKHRVVIGLSSLSLTNLAIMRKASLIAFSNYLAFNPLQRSKDQITKTKYSKVVQVAQAEPYCDALIINTKISNYLLDNHSIYFAVFIDTTNRTDWHQQMNCAYPYDLLIFHAYDESKSIFVPNLSFQDTEMKIAFNQIEIQVPFDLAIVNLHYLTNLKWHSETIGVHFMPAILQFNNFGECAIFKGSEYYVILIKKALVEVY